MYELQLDALQLKAGPGIGSLATTMPAQRDCALHTMFAAEPLGLTGDSGAWRCLRAFNSAANGIRRLETEGKRHGP